MKCSRSSGRASSAKSARCISGGAVFDHAVTRFSGRTAPPREGADKITVEAYSHEVISHGFWPGGNGVEAAFYSYTAPEPAGLDQSQIEPRAAFYSKDMKEFLLPYDAVRQSPSPETALMDFLQSTYEAGANLAKWDRKALERQDTMRSVTGSSPTIRKGSGLGQ